MMSQISSNSSHRSKRQRSEPDGREEKREDPEDTEAFWCLIKTLIKCHENENAFLKEDDARARRQENQANALANKRQKKNDDKKAKRSKKGETDPRLARDE